MTAAITPRAQDVLLAYMPLGVIQLPSLGLSLLKGALEHRGVRWDVRYFNLEGGAAQSVSHSMSICGNTWHVGTFDFRVSPATFTPDTTETDQWASRTDGCD